MCAYFVKKGVAWACISDDMDMFAYGCPRVVREWNIYKQSAVFYNFIRIKQDIKLDDAHSLPVLVLAGNDYMKKEKCSFTTIMEWYRVYIDQNERNEPFYQWLVDNGHIDGEKKDQLEEICQYYEVPDNIVLKKIPNQKPLVQWNTLQSILSPYGFVFIV